MVPRAGPSKMRLRHIWLEGWDVSLPPCGPSTWASLHGSWSLRVTVPRGQVPVSDGITFVNAPLTKARETVKPRKQKG